MAATATKGRARAGKTEAGAQPARSPTAGKLTAWPAEKAREAAIQLKHVSDPTRLRLIMMLTPGEQNVGNLCGALGQSQPAVSHHLALLRHARIVTPRREGKNNLYSLTPSGTMLAGCVNALFGGGATGKGAT